MELGTEAWIGCLGWVGGRIRDHLSACCCLEDGALEEAEARTSADWQPLERYDMIGQSVILPYFGLTYPKVPVLLPQNGNMATGQLRSLVGKNVWTGGMRAPGHPRKRSPKEYILQQ